MRLLNIYNKGRIIYLFRRDSEGRLFITKESSFYPYFYESSNEEDLSGKKSLTGVPVKKIIVSHPRDIPKSRTNKAWEADLFLTQRYMIDKVDTIEKCPIKWAMLDIETLSPTMPDATEAKDPVSCITIYNNFSKEYKTYYIKDYESEYKMMDAFIEYVKKEKFDMIIAYNMIEFDMKYLCNRFPDFAERISPIGETRYGGEIDYPAGISIVDYYLWLKNVTLNREPSYKLDDIAQKYLGDKSKGDFEFGVLSEEIKAKNKLDVEQLVRLEEQKQIIPYFDEVRRLAKVEWEDLTYPSRIIDSLLLSEAKKQNIVLPMKPLEERNTLSEKENFSGGYRKAFKTGFLKNIGSYDLSSCYPSAIRDFCLDPVNIKLQKEKDCIEVNGTYFNQKKDAILPTVVGKLLTLKNDIKEKLSTMSVDDPDYKNVEQQYSAIKAIANSSFGVFGNRFFRLYNKKVASAITFIARSLLHYIKDKITEKGYELLYLDTDGVMISGKENLTEYLNKLVQQWSKETFKKEKVGIEFAYEGHYKKILILALCRYVGELIKPNGEFKEVIKGVEIKRKDSTVFMKKFQKELVKQIMNEVNKEEIISWIKSQIEDIKNAPLEDIAFPCKLGKSIEKYSNVPVFLRAMNNTEDFEKKVGENFFWIYVISDEYDMKTQIVELLDGEKLTPSKLKKPWAEFFGEKVLAKDMIQDKKEKLTAHLEKAGRITREVREVKGKLKDVVAFDKDNKEHIKNVDWKRIEERNIKMKLVVIFEAMKWNLGEINYE